MKKFSTIFGVATMFALLLGLFAATTARAHEQRDIGEDGQFHVIVGFLNEPAIQGELNAISVQISTNDPDATPPAEGEQVEREPIEGLANDLTFEIIFEDQTMELPVRAKFGEPGHYVGYVIPTQPGVYSFHITGEIDGVAVDETFTAGPETFSEVEPRTDLEFPATSE